MKKLLQTHLLLAFMLCSFLQAQDETNQNGIQVIKNGNAWFEDQIANLPTWGKNKHPTGTIKVPAKTRVMIHRPIESAEGKKMPYRIRIVGLGSSSISAATDFPAGKQLIDWEAGKSKVGQFEQGLERLTILLNSRAKLTLTGDERSVYEKLWIHSAHGGQILLAGVTRVAFRDCQFTRCGIKANSYSTVTFDNCFWQVTPLAIDGTNCRKIALRDCYLEGCNKLATLGNVAEFIADSVEIRRGRGTILTSKKSSIKQLDGTLVHCKGGPVKVEINGNEIELHKDASDANKSRPYDLGKSIIRAASEEMSGEDAE